MIKKYFILTIVFALCSCHSKIYISDLQNQNTGLDFTRGKWLINEVDCPNEVYGKLYGTINQDFDKYLNGRLFLRNQINSILLPKKIKFNPSKTELGELKKTTLFDYFVNVKAEKLKDDLKAIDITNHKHNKRMVNKCSVLIEVYDLNLLEILYSEKLLEP